MSVWLVVYSPYGEDVDVVSSIHKTKEGALKAKEDKDYPKLYLIEEWEVQDD